MAGSSPAMTKKGRLAQMRFPCLAGEAGWGVLLPHSCLGHEAVHDFLVAGLVEFDRQLVFLDRLDGAVAEFLVEDAVAGGEAADMADLGAARGRAAVDERRAPGVAPRVVAAGEVEIGEIRPGAAPDAAEAPVAMR